MNDLKPPKKNYLVRALLALAIFLVEFYLYVFVRNDNILDLFVTIAAGILFIVSLTLHIVHSRERDSNKKP